jgi:hypothetical protein
MSKAFRFLAPSSAIALLALAAPAMAGDPPAAHEATAAVHSYAIGDVVEDVTLPDFDGQSFALSKERAIDDAAAWDAVASAAKVTANVTDVKAGDTRELDALPGVKGDAAKRLAFARAAGRRFGLLPSEAVAAKWKTLADAEGWIKTQGSAPLVFICWAMTCPTSKAYEDRFEAIASDTGARVYLLATKYSEKDADIKGYVDAKGLPFRVLDDRDLKLTERLGGKRTPHAFVVDAKNALRYAGGIDDDAGEEKAETARANWLRDALAAVGKDQTPRVLLTTPVG